MNWIKCSDKLPKKKNGNILTWVVSYDNRIPAFFVENKIKNGVWLYNYQITVTHWMYIENPFGD